MQKAAIAIVSYRQANILIPTQTPGNLCQYVSRKLSDYARTESVSQSVSQSSVSQSSAYSFTQPTFTKLQ